MTTFTDDFNRANGGLGSNWTDGIAGMGINSNVARGTTSQTSFAYVATGVASFGANQSAEGIVGALSGASQYATIILRGSGNNCYEFYTDGNAGAGGTAIAIISSGSETELQPIATGFANGDLMGFGIVGNVLTAYKNGASIGTYTDTAGGGGGATFTSGQPGIGSYGLATIDDFSATDGAAAGLILLRKRRIMALAEALGATRKRRSSPRLFFVGNYDVSATDAITPTDAATTQTVVDAAATDAVAPGDSATTQTVVGADAADAVALADSAESQLTLEASATDAATLGDSATTQTVVGAEATDALAPADEATAQLTLEASATDAATLDDSASSQATMGAEASDAITAGDSATSDSAADESATDSIAPEDSATTQAVVDAAASDAAALADSSDTQAVMGADAADAVALADSAAAAVTSAAEATDSIAPGDSATIVGNVYDVSATDGLDLTDSADAQATIGADALDGLDLADSATAPGTFAVEATDAIAPGDSATASGTSAGNEEVLAAIAALEALMEQRFAELKNEIRTPATFYAMDAREPDKGTSSGETADERKRRRIAENNAQILAMVAAIVGGKEPPK